MSNLLSWDMCGLLLIEQLVSKTWAAVLRVPTTTGNLYFKAPAEAFAFEPALTETLNRLIPTSVPPVLVIDRHWMLMKDGGMALRDDAHEPAHLEEALRQYAQVQ